MSEPQDILEKTYRRATNNIARSFVDDNEMSQFWLGLDIQTLGLIARL